MLFFFLLCLTVSAELICRGVGFRCIIRHFLRKRRMVPCQVVLEATYPPYLQTIFIFYFFFFNFLFSNFYIFFPSLSLINTGPMWAIKCQNATSPTVYVQSQPNFTINKVAMGEYKKCIFLPQVKNFIAFWFFLFFFVNTGPREAKIAKSYPSNNFHSISVKLYGQLSTMREYRMILSWQSAKFFLNVALKCATKCGKF